MDNSRKLMLIATGACIFFFALWTLFLMFVELMAESGGKNSDPLLAVLLLWPLGEAIWSWVWLLRHSEQYQKSRRSALGNTLFLAALISPLLLMLAITYFGFHGANWLFFAPTIVCCHAARLLWSDAQEERAEHAAQ